MVFRDNQWFDDQLLVLETYQEIGDQLEIATLDKNFCNYEFDREAPIWTCKGPDRKENPVYLERRAAYA